MTVEEYIAKFEAIPKENWVTGCFRTFDGRCCALGHLGARQGYYPLSASALTDLLNNYLDLAVCDVNDNSEHNTIPGTDPRQRILNALTLIQLKMRQTL